MYNENLIPMAVEVRVRKWGNSLGIILPRELIKTKSLKENEIVLVEVAKEANIERLFGTFKRKMSGQKFKDMVRKGWEN